MKRKLQLALCGIAVACCIGSGAFAATMDFEGIGLGTRYGGGEGDNPGDVVLTQGGIDMSVETFYYGSFDGFNYAEIGGQFAGFFPTTPLETNNISVKFDFSNLGFDVTLVTLEYQEFGGIDNFAVNGHTIYELTSLLDIPITDEVVYNACSPFFYFDHAYRDQSYVVYANDLGGLHDQAARVLRAYCMDVKDIHQKGPISFDGKPLALVCLRHREADLDITLERAQPDVPYERAVIPVIDCQDKGSASRIRWPGILLDQELENPARLVFIGMHLAGEPLLGRGFVAQRVHGCRIVKSKGPQDECVRLYPE